MSDPISELENGTRSPVASGSSDPASSLRAAALLTLKSKRRKPVVDTSGSSGPSQRPLTTDTSVQLDYGQEDIASSPTDVVMAPVPLKDSHPDMEDGQLREEGEISDSEDSASKSIPGPSAVVKAESPTYNLLDRIEDPPHPRPSLTPIPLGDHFVDADHVRPGLAMNQDQYDTAKDIVLDLLGWGVPPDYLVDCNLSREIVYYVFSELNLRLPQNLDITGLIPYSPTHVALLSRLLSSIPPSARPEIPAAPRPLHGHPSLPPKPLGSNFVNSSGPSPAQRLVAPLLSPPLTSSPPIAPSPPGTQQTLGTGSLHDMERQRRQELLARKAVQASRKVKPPSDASSTASSSFAPADPTGALDQDVEMTSTIATEAVDDFLKTIGEKSATPEALIQPQSIDTMDIDEIPGLGGSASHRSTGSSFYDIGPESHSQMSTYTDQVVISPAESSYSAAQTHSLSQNDAPPSSGESGSTAFGLEQAGYVEQLSQHPALQRRQAKRPTAADFVDFDSGSRNNGSVPPLRRKTASFASVSGHRKLVIDLSDSEGEGGEDYAMHELAEWEVGSGYSSPAPGRYSATPISAGAGGWATPPYVGAGTMTPAALMEKEQEIRKMRELIAQREKSRLQKAMSRSSTATSALSQRRDDEEGTTYLPPTNGPTSNGYHAHQQEDGSNAVVLADKRDSTMAASTSTSASATPPHFDPDETVDQRGPGATHTGTQDLATADAAPQELINGSSLPEASQEPATGLVDVDSASSSSAQPRSPTTPAHPRPDGSRPTSPAPPSREDSKYDYYAAYDSPFKWYPLLRLRSRLMSSGNADPTSQSPTASCSANSSSSLSSFPSTSSISSSISSLSSSTYNSVLPRPDLRPLRLATCSALDSAKRVCQYEVPGGGVCRDEGCEDMHLDRLGDGVGEPSDHDTAEYLYDWLPPAWATQHGASVAGIATCLQQARGKTGGLEERVAWALAAMGRAGPT